MRTWNENNTNFINRIYIFRGHDYPLMSTVHMVLIGIHHKTDRALDPTITTSTSQSQLQAIPTLPSEAHGNSLLPFACLAPKDC